MSNNTTNGASNGIGAGAGAAAAATENPCMNYATANCVGKASKRGSNNLSYSCDVTEAQCFKTRSKDSTLFDNINWDALYADRNDFFEKFIENLKSDERFKELLFKVFDEKLSYIKKFDEAVSIVLPLAKSSKCSDINMAFSFPQTNAKGEISNQAKENFRLFHIALHSEFPVYKIGKLRSKDACAAFVKKSGETAVGSGTFHYKIDNLPRINLIFGKDKNRTSEANAPYKEIEFELVDGVPKIKMDESPFIYPDASILSADASAAGAGAGAGAGAAGAVAGASLINSKKAEIEALHMYIFNKFAEHWNSYDKLATNYKKGGRRTRRYRAARRKTRRIH